MSFLHIFAIEASENQDFFFVHLGYTEALTCRELFSSELNDFPGALGHIIKSFYRVNVFLCRVRYPTEHIDEAVHERAACVVMTALIHLREIKPEVDIDVVALSLDLSLLIFFTRTCHNDESVT